MITKTPSQKVHPFLSNGNGKNDVITGDISYSGWFSRDSGANRDEQRVLGSPLLGPSLAPFTNIERGEQSIYCPKDAIKRRPQCQPPHEAQQAARLAVPVSAPRPRVHSPTPSLMHPHALDPGHDGLFPSAHCHFFFLILL